MATWNDDGSIVATASAAGTISIRDGATFEVIREVADAGDFRLLGSPHLSADDSLFLSTFVAPYARLWDVAASGQIGIDFPNFSAPLVYGNQDADDLRLVTGAAEYALIRNVDIDSWPEVACRVAGSNLTAEEWEQFGPLDTERYAICPDVPLPRLTEDGLKQRRGVVRVLNRGGRPCEPRRQRWR